MVLSTDSLNPYTYIYAALMMIQVMHYIPFQQCPAQSVNQLKFVVDRPGWQKSFFQDMVDLEIFDPSVLALLDCIRFWFMSILRKELTYIANEWNRHQLSPNRNNAPSGRPDAMYFLHHLYGTTDHMISINTAETDEFIDITSAVTSDFSDESREFAETLMNENNMEMPHDASSAFELYLYRLSKIEKYSQTTLNVFDFASIKF